MNKIILKAFRNHLQALESLKNQQLVIDKIANLFIDSLEKGGKIIFMGNGGSAADAQHLAAELVGRFKLNRRALASIALTTDTSIITAIGNDFGYDSIFQRQVEALANANDILVGISASGNSSNIIKAIEYANTIGVHTVGLLGREGGVLKDLTKVSIIINSVHTAHIQEMHEIAGHILCEIVESNFSVT